MSTLGLVIFVAIRTLEHGVYSYFLSRNIICKKVSTLTANVLKSPARFSSYEWSGFIAAFAIVSFFVDRPCSSSRFSNDSTFNYNHFAIFSLILCIPSTSKSTSEAIAVKCEYFLYHLSTNHVSSSFLLFIFLRILGFWSCIM
jgi:hypothetical protein